MARLVTVDIKGFTDSQQAKILRALCRKDEGLREKVAHMLQIAYGERLSAAVPVLDDQQSANQPNQPNQTCFPEVPARSSSRRRRSGSGSLSTIPSRSTSAGSTEPMSIVVVPAGLSTVEPTTTAPATTRLVSTSSTSSTSTSTTSTTDSTTPTPPPPGRVEEFDVREKWMSARARIAATGGGISRTQSVRVPKGPRARPTTTTTGGYVSDGEHATSPRRPTARENAQRYVCRVCDQVFTNQTNSSHSCRHHHGSLELDVDADTWMDWYRNSDGNMDTKDNRSLFPDGFRWTCCNRSGSRAGCQRTSHCVDPRLMVR